MAAMNNYEYLKKNKKKIKELYAKGFVSAKAINDVELYERYLRNRKKYKKKMMAYQVTADENGVSLRTILRIIKLMESK